MDRENRQEEKSGLKRNWGRKREERMREIPGPEPRQMTVSQT